MFRDGERLAPGPQFALKAGTALPDDVCDSA